MFKIEVMEKLIALSKSEPEDIEFIEDCLKAFEEYHKAVFEEQTYVRLYSGVEDGAKFREKRESLDKNRTACHNKLIVHMNILNRLAENAGLPKVYDGVVSEDKPYRREVAGAAFEYVQYIIENR